MTPAEPVNRFQKVYQQHVNDMIFFPLGDAYHFYQWMIANQFWSAASEEFEDVGPWVKRGLIVSKFLYPHFADKAGVSTKTVSRYLSKIVEQGFAVVLQQGGFVDKGRTKPFVVAVGAWRHRASDGMREAYHVGWMNTLDGLNGRISFEELQSAAALVAERGDNARAHLANAREMWRLKKEATILGEAEEDPGKTEPSSQTGKTELFSHGQTELFSATEIASTEIETEIKHSVAEKSAPVERGPKPVLQPGEDRMAYVARLQAWYAAGRQRVGVGHPVEGSPIKVADGEQGGRAEEGGKPNPPASIPSSSATSTIPPQKVDDQDRPSPPSSAPPPSSKGRKPKKEPAEKKPRPRNPLFDAVVPFAAGSHNPEAMAAVDGSLVGKIVSTLQKNGITTPEEVAIVGRFILDQRPPDADQSIMPPKWVEQIPKYIGCRNEGKPFPKYGSAGNRDAKHQASKERARRLAEAQKPVVEAPQQEPVVIADHWREESW